MKYKYLLLTLLANTLIYTNTSVAQTGIITTIAGTGSCGYNGDGIPAVSAQINTPISVTLDSAGNIYFSDHINNRVRKINPTGIISTVAGDGIIGYTGDGGNATVARINNPTGVAVDNSGNVYFSDEQNNVIRKVNSAGFISTIAGDDTSGYSGDGGPATAAKCYLPYEATTDNAGNLYFVDQDNNVVRKVDASGIITTVAGNNTFGYSGDGGPATAAQLYYPTGIKADGTGNLYIADRGNNLIRKVNSLGIISSVAGTNFYGYSGDGGPATAAKLSYPSGVTVDNAGNIYFSDSYNHRIRMVSPAGIITTVAGDGTMGFSGDGGAATLASLDNPMGVAVDDSGNLYIADVFNCVLRKVNLGLPASLSTKQLTPSANTISLFPDPNKGAFTLSYRSNSGIAEPDQQVSIEVMNVIGKVVYKNTTASHSGQINAQIKLDDDLPNGMYLLNLKSEAETKTVHFVIER